MKFFEGSFSCRCGSRFTGFDGFTGDGHSCDDIDECADGTHSCSTNAICSNNVGSFECDCVEGFSGDGHSCFDMNECSSDLDTCDPENSICVNTPGSFTCQCKQGNFVIFLLEL